MYLIIFFFFGYALTVESDKKSGSTSESETDLQILTDSESMDVEIGIIVYLWLIIRFCIAVINILCSYWFIRGITSVRRRRRHIKSRNFAKILYLPQKQPAKMKYYMIILGVDIVLLLLQFDILFLLLAVFECYVFICSYSLYVVCTSSFQDDGNNAENAVIRNEQNPAPPPYDSMVESDMQGPTAGTYPKLHP